MIVSSFAGTGKSYVPIQFRTSEIGVHVQVNGHSENRPYGLSCNAISPTFVKFFTKLYDVAVRSKPSLAGTSALYKEARVRVDEDGNLKWQVEVVDTLGFKESMRRDGYISFRSKSVIQDFAEYINAEVELGSEAGTWIEEDEPEDTTTDEDYSEEYDDDLDPEDEGDDDII